MTLLPSDDFGIKGYPGEAYAVNNLCAVPGCIKPSVHAHHMWPRSFLRNQPQEWVQLLDGTILGNRIGLCFNHHDDVSSPVGGHKARIVFSGGVFWWEEKVPDEHVLLWEPAWRRVGPLDPQPPVAGQTIAATPSNGDACPTCGKRKTKKAIVPSEPRSTSIWSLKVPDDAEIGSEILDGWADDLAVVLGFDDATSRLRRYHAVATALAWTIQNRDDFVRDLLAAR